MSELLLSHLIGRRVRDAAGAPLGRIEEVRAEIELHAEGADYVVVEYHVGDYGALERLAGSRFARHALGLLRTARQHRIRWEDMDLSDPENPVARAKGVPA